MYTFNGKKTQGEKWIADEGANNFILSEPPAKEVCYINTIIQGINDETTVEDEGSFAAIMVIIHDSNYVKMAKPFVKIKKGKIQIKTSQFSERLEIGGQIFNKTTEITVPYSLDIKKIRTQSEIGRKSYYP